MINIIKLLMFRDTVHPVSRKFGFDRGKPIDRYYIEKFLSKNKKYIKGTVLEIADSNYTKMFGGKGVERSIVLSYEDAKGVDIVGDLVTGKGIPYSVADCAILPQTLPFIFDVRSAIKNSLRLLKPRGILLVTTPGITQISRYDMDRWGHYWSFTDLSLRKLFEEVVPKKNISIMTYGNVKSASYFLYGLSCTELKQRDLDFKDDDYQVTIAAIIKKPLRNK
jgi:hypothetical protein